MREIQKRKSNPAGIVDRGPIGNAACNSFTVRAHCYVAICKNRNIKCQYIVTLNTSYQTFKATNTLNLIYTSKKVDKNALLQQFSMFVFINLQGFFCYFLPNPQRSHVENRLLEYYQPTSKQDANKVQLIIDIRKLFIYKEYDFL